MEVKQLSKEKRKAHLEYKSSQSQEKYRRYIEIRNKVNSLIKKIKTEYWQRFTNEMKHDMNDAQKKYGKC